MKKRGFTIVELVVSFALAMTIAVFLFQIILSVKTLYTNYNQKTLLYNKQSVISNVINKKINSKTITAVTSCEINCLNIFYEDNTSDILKLDSVNNTFQFGDYKTILVQGSRYGSMQLDNYIVETFDETTNNTILILNIPIYDDLFKDVNFGINIVYQYNRSMTGLLLTDSKYFIRLIGGDSVKSLANVAYTDTNYQVFDYLGNVDPSLTVAVTNPFATMSLPYPVGNYEIIYQLKDASNKVLQKKVKKVEIYETFDIVLNGDKEVHLDYNASGGSYNDPTVTVKNSAGKTITDLASNKLELVKTTTGPANSLNTNRIGQYTITYTLNQGGVPVNSLSRTVYVEKEYTFVFDYTGSSQIFNVPVTGKYKLEVWGAEGGGSRLSGNAQSGVGGLGGYSVGTINLNEKDNLYIYVGGSGKSSDTTTALGGFNGGGNANGSSNTEPGNGGGGATDIRVKADSLYARVIVAGGGGGGGEDAGDPYGHGGGLTGVDGVATSLNASQTAAGTNGSFGVGATTNLGDGGGGGGGWYGGGTVQSASVGGDTQGGGGGSGYVYTTSSVANYPSGKLLNTTHYLTDANTYAGNTSFINTAGTANETGHQGNGYAKITFKSHKVLATNKLPNSSFENTGWAGCTFSTAYKKYGSYSCQITATASVPEAVIVLTSNINLDNTHIYYGRVEGYQTTKTASGVQIYWPIAEPSFGSVAFGNSGTWNMYSFLVNRTTFTSGNYPLRFDFDNRNVAGTVYYDGGMLIDLTETFGAGNEPTKEWCDANIPYFDSKIFLN